jgi:hypothetical protein
MCYGHLAASEDGCVFDRAWQLPQSAPLAVRKPIPQCNHFDSEASKSYLQSSRGNAIVFYGLTTKVEV